MDRVSEAKVLRALRPPINGWPSFPTLNDDVRVSAVRTSQARYLSKIMLLPRIYHRSVT